MSLSKTNKNLYKDVVSLVSYANETRTDNDPVEFSHVEKVALRELESSNDEAKALSRASEFVLAKTGLNLEYKADLDLFPEDYIHNRQGVESKIAWLKENSYLNEKKTSLIAAAVNQDLSELDNIHAWKRLEVLLSTGQITKDLYNLVVDLEKEAVEEHEL